MESSALDPMDDPSAFRGLFAGSSSISSICPGTPEDVLQCSSFIVFLDTLGGGAIAYPEFQVVEEGVRFR